MENEREYWINSVTGEIKEFTDGEQFFMFRITEGMDWKSGLSRADLLLLLDIGENISGNGRYVISRGQIEIIAEKSGLTIRTIKRSLKKLDELNVITEIHKGVYIANPEILFKSPARKMGEMKAMYYSIRKKAKEKAEK